MPTTDSPHDGNDEAQAHVEEARRYGYEAHVAPAMNGIIIKVGCKILVGSPDDLKMLSTYYKGKVPDKFKKAVGKGPGAFRHAGACAPCDEVACDKACSTEDEVIGPPSFIHNSISETVYAVSNGWVVVKSNGSVWIARTRKDLISVLLAEDE